MFNKSIWSTISACFILSCCVGDNGFDVLTKSCSNSIEANAGFEEIIDLYQGETIQIQEDLIIEGYVISSDRAGNFFSVLHFQDHPIQPSQGLQIEIDLRDSYLLYEVGSKILVKTKGLYLGKSGDAFKLGGTFTAFGNISVGRLPALKVTEHIVLSCEDLETVQPKAMTIDSISNDDIGTLISFESVEINEAELGLPFAVETEETERTLVDCMENGIALLNSGYADFQEEILPKGNGTVLGVLVKDGNDFQLVIRDLNDVNLSNDRCPEIITEFTSTKV
ncbi:MAG: DUF5689 domain-containing protein, partial [Flavobacteriaceae bacterium]